MRGIGAAFEAWRLTTARIREAGRESAKLPFLNQKSPAERCWLCIFVFLAQGGSAPPPSFGGLTPAGLVIHALLLKRACKIYERI
jgi:hypothetical protein